MFCRCRMRKLFRKIPVGLRKAKYADQKPQVVYEGVHVYIMYGAVLCRQLYEFSRIFTDFLCPVR